MTAEVDELVISTDQADRARQAAERVCQEAKFRLCRAPVASLVDEIVSEAMCISEVSKDLRRTKTSSAKLQNVEGDNKKLKENRSSLEKEHMDWIKREKRGVVPVLKEVKFLQGKLAEVGKRSKTFRDRSAKVAAEEASMERV